MIDFHSHILPKMDDGSSGCRESVALLRESYRQGVDVLASTSHYYAEQNSPREFLKRREASWNRLQEELTDDMPAIRLGAEVQYFEGITKVKEVDDLRLEGTRILLLEMPFSEWSERAVRDAIELNRRPDYIVLLAHIERYMAWQHPSVWDTLRDEGILMQCNPGFFLNWRTKWKAMKMLEAGKIDLLGSDCHNMDSRPPRLKEAMEAIEKKLGRKPLKNIDQLGRELLNE